MDVKKLALLIGALVMAGVSAFMARSLFTGSAAPQAAAQVAPVGPEILVASRALPVGTIIGPESFRYQPWPKELVEKAYYIKGTAGFEPASLQGTVVRTEITAGQPITQGALVKPGDRGFLAAALGPGMRAVTVSVAGQAGAGVAGFIFPGDRVDIMLTQTVPGGGDGPPLKTTETFVRNMRVLATDQKSEKTVDDKGQTIVTNYQLVTMEATPKISEKIAVAQTIGTLSLALRPLADNNAELERAIASGDVKLPEGDDPKGDKQLLIQIASRPVDTDTTFTTGADVSRYQRSTVPAKPATGGGGIPPQVLGAAPAPAAAAPAAGGTGQPVSFGPVIRIARGNTITAVPAGGK